MDLLTFKQLNKLFLFSKSESFNEKELLVDLDGENSHYNLYEAQFHFLSTLKSEIQLAICQDPIEEDLSLAIKNNPRLNKMLIQVRTHLDKVASYINLEEYISK